MRTLAAEPTSHPDPTPWFVTWVDPPPPWCSPNRKGNWRAKTAATRAYREHVRARAALVLNHGERPTWPAARVRFTFYYPDAGRRRDRTNLAAAMKAAVDALVDVGLLADDEDVWVPRPRIERSPPGEELPVVRVDVRPIK
jgi:hypothetical protein